MCDPWWLDEDWGVPDVRCLWCGRWAPGDDTCPCVLDLDEDADCDREAAAVEHLHHGPDGSYDPGPDIEEDT